MKVMSVLMGLGRLDDEKLVPDFIVPFESFLNLSVFDFGVEQIPEIENSEFDSTESTLAQQI